MSPVAAGRRATLGYAELLFAWGFARVGDEEASRAARAAAPSYLQCDGRSEFFRSLMLAAYDARITQALAGEPHAGPAPGEVGETIDRLYLGFDGGRPDPNDPSGRAISIIWLGPALALSRVLEPDRLIEVYYPWFKHSPSDSTDRSGLWGRRPGPLGAAADQISRIPALCETAGSPAPGWMAAAGRAIRELLGPCHALPVDQLADRVPAVFEQLPAVPNSFTSSVAYSRWHFAITDAAVLAVAGTGPRPPAVEWPARRALLHRLRPLVLSWIEKVP